MKGRKEKKKTKTKESIQDLWNVIKGINIHIFGIHKSEERVVEGIENLFNEMIPERA
jgi:hypothetical protein